VTPDGRRGRTVALCAVLLLALCALLPLRRVILGGHLLHERDIQAFRWGQLEAFAGPAVVLLLVRARARAAEAPA